MCSNQPLTWYLQLTFPEQSALTDRVEVRWKEIHQVSDHFFSLFLCSSFRWILFCSREKKIQSLFLLSHNQLILAPNILYFSDQKNLNVLDTEKPEEGVCTGALALIFLLKIPFIPTYLKVNVYYRVCQMNLYLELGITLLAKLF